MNDNQSIEDIINSLITLDRKKNENQEQPTALVEENLLHALTIISSNRNIKYIEELECLLNNIYKKLIIDDKCLSEEAFATLVKIISIMHFEYFNDLITGLKKDKEISEECLRKGIIAAQENERRQVSAILHDDIVQSLASILLRLQMLGDIIKESHQFSYLMRKELVDIEGIIRNIITQCRLLAVDRDVLLLEKAGFAPVLDSLILKFKNKTNIQIQTDLNSLDLLKLPQSLHFFRIIREALTNIEKHAQASKVFLEFKIKSDEYVVIIKDNGKGFANIDNFKKTPSSEHFGLYSIEQRVKLLKGKFQIYSIPGEGANLTITVPVENCKKLNSAKNRGKSPWIR